MGIALPAQHALLLGYQPAGDMDAAALAQLQQLHMLANYAGQEVGLACCGGMPQLHTST
jgi:hypothetical protein